MTSKTLRLLTVAAGVSAISLSAMAWEPGSGASKVQKRDTDNNQQISKDEATAAFADRMDEMKKLFKAGDLNQDGVITSDELKDKDAFAKMDSDKNGKITEDEFLNARANYATDKFDAADKNKDGEISAGEAESAAKAGTDKRQERRKKWFGK